MKKWITIIFLVLIAAGSLAVECDPMGSHNGWTNLSTDPIDTTKIVHLKEPVNIKMSVKVREFDFIKKRDLPVDSSLVHFFNKDTITYTDTAGYTNITFLTDTLPYKYGFEIIKTGYKKEAGYNWDTVKTINNSITIERIQ